MLYKHLGSSPSNDIFYNKKDMIQKLSKIKITDNSGARLVQCINLVGNYAGIGDVITVSVKETRSGSKIAKGQIHKAVIIRTKKLFKRANGHFICFDDNAAVIVNNSYSPVGSRVFGPVPSEILSKGFTKISSISSHII